MGALSRTKSMFKSSRFRRGRDPPAAHASPSDPPARYDGHTKSMRASDQNQNQRPATPPLTPDDRLDVYDEGESMRPFDEDESSVFGNGSLFDDLEEEQQQQMQQPKAFPQHSHSHSQPTAANLKPPPPSPSDSPSPTPRVSFGSLAKRVGKHAPFRSTTGVPIVTSRDANHFAPSTVRQSRMADLGVTSAKAGRREVEEALARPNRRPDASKAAFGGPVRYDWMDIETAAAVKVQSIHRRNLTMNALAKAGLETPGMRNRRRAREANQKTRGRSRFGNKAGNDVPFPFNLCGVGLVFGDATLENDEVARGVERREREKERRARIREEDEKRRKAFKLRKKSDAHLDEGIEVIENFEEGEGGDTDGETLDDDDQTMDTAGDTTVMTDPPVGMRNNGRAITEDKRSPTDDSYNSILRDLANNGIGVGKANASPKSTPTRQSNRSRVPSYSSYSSASSRDEDLQPLPDGAHSPSTRKYAI